MMKQRRKPVLLEVWPRKRRWPGTGWTQRTILLWHSIVIDVVLYLVFLMVLAWVTREARADDSLSTYRVTAYCPCKVCCGPRARGITADGTKVKAGMLLVAAPRGISFGTILDIPGYGVAPVADRGGAIKGKCLDVLFALSDGKGGIDLKKSHQAAREWGVRTEKVRRVK